MWRRISQKFLNKKTFYRGSLVLVLTSILSYILGLLRDRGLAHYFGASQILGAYEAAFILPDLILNIFVAGGLSAAFIPIFNNLNRDNKTDEGDEFISSVINGSLLIVFLAGVLVYITLPWLGDFIVPGFDSDSKDLFINLTKILLLSPLIFALSNTLGNILLGRESFFWFGISASFYNLGTILGIIFLADKLGIYGVALGTLAGALLHLIVRFLGLRNFHFKYRPRIYFNEYYRRFLKILTPKMIQHPIEELTFMGFTVIASTLATGSIVFLTFARNFQVMPINTIGVNFALAIFPTLARLAATGEKKEFKTEMNFTIKSILSLTIPGAILIYLLRQPLIAFFLGGGAFDVNAINMTAATLGMFALSIPTESVAQVLARGFYAMRDSLTPVMTSIFSLIIAVVAGYILSFRMGVSGLALGYFLGSVIKTIFLYFLLKRRADTIISSPL